MTCCSAWKERAHTETFSLLGSSSHSRSFIWKMFLQNLRHFYHVQNYWHPSWEEAKKKKIDSDWTTRVTYDIFSSIRDIAYISVKCLFSVSSLTEIHSHAHCTHLLLSCSNLHHCRYKWSASFFFSKRLGHEAASYCMLQTGCRMPRPRNDKGADTGDSLQKGGGNKSSRKLHISMKVLCLFIYFWLNTVLIRFRIWMRFHLQ